MLPAFAIDMGLDAQLLGCGLRGEAGDEGPGGLNNGDGEQQATGKAKAGFKDGAEDGAKNRATGHGKLGREKLWLWERGGGRGAAAPLFTGGEDRKRGWGGPEQVDGLILRGERESWSPLAECPSCLSQLFVPERRGTGGGAGGFWFGEEALVLRCDRVEVLGKSAWRRGGLRIG